MNRNLIGILGLFTLFGFSLLAAVIIEYGIEAPFFSIFEHGMAWYVQIPLGLSYGIASAWLGWKIIQLKALDSVRKFYSSLVSELNLSLSDVLFISICAGIGEEILFRGAIQYYLGIWITAVLFVAIHGYLNPKNWRLTVYGVFMTLIMVGMGYLFENAGVLCVISAHFIIDVYLLLKMQPKADVTAST